MAAQTLGRGRPRGSLGPVAQRVLQAIQPEGMTAAQLAAAVQVSRGTAKLTCSRLRAAGLLGEAKRVPAPGSHKRAIVYVRVQPSAAATVIGLPAGFFSA